MLTDYLRAALRQARYEIIPDEGLFYGEIPGFEGVFAAAPTLEDCREQLSEVLEDWILVRVSLHLALPEAGGLRIAVGVVA